MNFKSIFIVDYRSTFFILGIIKNHKHLCQNLIQDNENVFFNNSSIFYIFQL